MIQEKPFFKAQAGKQQAQLLPVGSNAHLLLDHSLHQIIKNKSFNCFVIGTDGTIQTHIFI